MLIPRLPHCKECKRKGNEMAGLFRALRADEIDARVAMVTKDGCSILLYKDARADMNILDETVGCENWQRKHELINGNLFCSVGIWSDTRSEWVWKQDVGTESNTEKEKGQASDSFKRACVNWGIGRELYTAPFIWFNPNEMNLKQNDDYNGKSRYTTKDRFVVRDIYYKNSAIAYLKIENDKTKHCKVYSSDAPPVDYISESEARVVKMMLEESGSDVKRFLGYFGVDCVEHLSKAQYVEASRKLNSKIEGKKNG